MMALLRATAGLIGWALAFSLLYAVQGLVCSPRVWPWVHALPLSGRELLIAAWLLCLAALAVLTMRLWPGPGRQPMLRWLAGILALIGLVSTAFTGFPVLIATTCAPA